MFVERQCCRWRSRPHRHLPIFGRSNLSGSLFRRRLAFEWKCALLGGRPPPSLLLWEQSDGARFLQRALNLARVRPISSATGQDALVSLRARGRGTHIALDRVDPNSIVSQGVVYDRVALVAYGAAIG